MKTNFNIPASLRQLISSEQAYHYHIIPAEVQNGTLTFRSDLNPKELKQELQIVLGKVVEIIPETPENIQHYLAANFRKSNQSESKDLHYSKDFLEKLLLTAKDIGSEVMLNVFRGFGYDLDHLTQYNL